MADTQPKPEVLEALRSQDWESIGRILTLHALQFSRRRLGIPSYGMRTVLGRSAEDIAQQVIASAFAGTRSWDPERGELLPTLRAQVESEVSNLLKRSAAKKEKTMDIANDCDDPTRNQREPAGDDPTPEQQAVLAEQETRASQEVEALFVAFAGDPEVTEVLDAILGGCEPKPRFLAERLNTTSTDINNRLRRLKRVVEKTRER